MRVFRLARKPFSRSPLDGRGGLFAAGRWHTPRRLVVYTSSSLALASLEVLVHCELDVLPTDLFAIEMSIPENIKIRRVEQSRMPRTWRKYPAPRVLQDMGNSWIDSESSCVLEVPSAVVPSESNFLINPKHSDIGRIEIVRRFNFRFDARLSSR